MDDFQLDQLDVDYIKAIKGSCRIEGAIYASVLWVLAIATFLWYIK